MQMHIDNVVAEIVRNSAYRLMKWEGVQTVLVNVSDDPMEVVNQLYVKLICDFCVSFSFMHDARVMFYVRFSDVAKNKAKEIAKKYDTNLLANNAFIFVLPVNKALLLLSDLYA